MLACKKQLMELVNSVVEEFDIGFVGSRKREPLGLTRHFETPKPAIISSNEAIPPNAFK